MSTGDGTLGFKRAMHWTQRRPLLFLKKKKAMKILKFDPF